MFVITLLRSDWFKSSTPSLRKRSRRKFAELLILILLPFVALCARAQMPGTPDSLNPNIVGQYVMATASQPDGSIIIAGNFTSVLGVPRQHIARIKADGTLDLGFNPHPDDYVYCVAVQPDGKILISGQFTNLQPNGATTTIARPFFARLNADGSVDNSFDPQPNAYVSSIATQADGKLLIVGSFSSLRPNGTPSPIPREAIARINPNGTVDTSFYPKPIGGPNCVAIQPDGKILLGGSFIGFQTSTLPFRSTPRRNVARLNPDGTLDSFDPSPDDFVTSLVVQTDGKILIGGSFITLQPNGAPAAATRSFLARVHSNGSLDADFNPGASAMVWSMGLQTDGKILVGGDFTTFQPDGISSPIARPHVARLLSNGQPDLTFDSSASHTVYGTLQQADGRVILGGSFSSVSSSARNCVARLNNDLATQTLSAPDPTQVLWERSGVSPEVSGVTFEQSVDGGNTWILLGAAQRVLGTPNWKLTGLSLPTGFSSSLRARGRTIGGYCNGSSGLVESAIHIQVTDQTPPVFSQVSFGDNHWLKLGASATLTFAVTDPPADEVTVAVYFGGKEVHPTKTGSFWSATFTVEEDTPEGLLSFSIQALDKASNKSTVTEVSDKSSVYIDRTAPALSEVLPIVVEATGPGGAVASFLATATDELGHYDPVIFTPASGTVFPLGVNTVSYSATDAAQNTTTKTFTVKVEDTTPPTVTPVPPQSLPASANGTAIVPDYTQTNGLAPHITAFDLVGITSIQQFPAPGTVLPIGAHAIHFNVQDFGGNVVTSDTALTIAFLRSLPGNGISEGTPTGQLAPGAGQDGLPADAIIKTFGPPAISDQRTLAARVTMASGRSSLAGIYLEDGAGQARLPAFQGMEAPGLTGAVFKSFLDPVTAPSSAIAFAARVQGTGIKAANDEGVWSDATGHGLALWLREGSAVPGAGGAKLKGVTSLSLRDGELLALVTLLPEKNLVTSGDDVALVRLTSEDAGAVLLRKGRELPGVPFSKIKTISVLAPALGSPGQGRWHSDEAVLAKVALSDQRTVIVKIAEDGAITRLLSTADPARSVDIRTGWKSFGLPAMGGPGTDFVVAASLKPQAGVVTAKDDSVLLFSHDGLQWSVLARENQPTSAPNAPRYASFFDPVVNDAGQVAFLATLQGSGVQAKNKTGLLCGSTDHLRLVARLNDPTPDESGANSGTVWTRFVSHALPSGPEAGVVFLAETNAAKNKLGLWAVDSTGTLRRLLRTGVALASGGSLITNLTLLDATPGAFGVARGYNETGSLAVLATLADKSQTLVRIDIP